MLFIWLEIRIHLIELFIEWIAAAQGQNVEFQNYESQKIRNSISRKKDPENELWCEYPLTVFSLDYHTTSLIATQYNRFHFRDFAWET